MNQEPTVSLFKEFNLSPHLIASLEAIGFEKATEVQQKTIPAIIDNKDVFAQAETGSGKTGAFAIPIIEQILRANDSESRTEYLVISPTRELAQQTHKVFGDIGQKLGVESICIIGGESFDKQKKLLEKNPRVLVATPGRLVDLIKQKLVDVRACKAVVFDEADRLFDMGFERDIEFVLKKVPRSRQMIMVSATGHFEVLKTAYKFGSSPVEFKLNTEDLLVENIDHKVAMISSDEKMPFLVSILRRNIDAYAIIFCNTQVQTHRVAEWLKLMQFKAMPISGRLPQAKRTKLMEDFRQKEVTILVCTDVAARGLDIKDVNLVVNFDLPQDSANYVHRIGRTGRAGKSGQAISFCAHEDCEMLDGIKAYIEASIPLLDVSDEDFVKDLCAPPRIDPRTLRLRDEVEQSDRKMDRNRNRRSRDQDQKREPRRENKKFDKPNHQEQKREFKKVDEDFEHAPLRELPAFVASEDATDSRVFVKSCYSPNEAIEQAKGYFQILDGSAYSAELIKKGKKKFIFFGPAINTYKVQLLPKFKEIVEPFLGQFFRRANLQLVASVNYEGTELQIKITGPDERMLARFENELLHAIDSILWTYLNKRIVFPKGLKIAVTSSFSNRKDKDLLGLVDKLAQGVLRSKKSAFLKPLSGPERKLVHNHLSNHPSIETVSHGDGKFKKMELKFKN